MFLNQKMERNKYRPIYKFLGHAKNLIFKGKISIPREPWPFIDVSGSQMIIGDRVTISSGVYIYTHGHQFHRIGWRDLDKVFNLRPTIIEDFAFIGVNAIIMPTCKYIGKHSVIGAASVITKDVPDYEIWGGNPGTKIGDVQ